MPLNMTGTLHCGKLSLNRDRQHQKDEGHDRAGLIYGHLIFCLVLLLFVITLSLVLAQNDVEMVSIGEKSEKLYRLYLFVNTTEQRFTLDSSL